MAQALSATLNPSRETQVNVEQLHNELHFEETAVTDSTLSLLLANLRLPESRWQDVVVVRLCLR